MNLKILASATLLFASLLTSVTAAATSLYAQRAAYKAALDHLTSGRTAEYRKLRASLADYVLLPYLDYYELQSQLSTVRADTVLEFRSSHPDLPVANLLFQRWLKRLGSQRKWQTFLDHFEPSDDAELRCYELRALHGTGQKDAAYSQVPYLWIVANSQPKACDPLFEAWIASGNLTEAMVWERLGLAIEANNRTLARYLLRFFESDVKHWAQAYYNVHVTPEAIARTDDFRTDNSHSRAVIRHGLQRLAQKQPTAATKAWLKYQDSHSFDAAAASAIESSLLVGHAKAGDFPPPQEPYPPEAAAALALAAVSSERWSDAALWIDRLDDQTRNERIWQYWLARALDSSVVNSERARRTFAALAEQRDYYGFLAADRIGAPVNLNHRPLTVSPLRVNLVHRIPAMARATELYAVGDVVNARREWHRLIPSLSPADAAAAASLAGEIGWISQSIRTANDGGLQDSLELRFPIAFREEFKRASHVSTVPEPFQFAIARQESAFDPSARSPANARGLMQLMQPTAEQVARRVGLTPPTVSELYDASLNVELAGHHLAALMARYERRRPQVAAAYNAGESRVDRWLRERSGLATDVWIETIPFSETRNYVKNVLAFAQVYGHRLGTPSPMLEVHETQIP